MGQIAPSMYLVLRKCLSSLSPLPNLVGEKAEAQGGQVASAGSESQVFPTLLPSDPK